MGYCRIWRIQETKNSARFRVKEDKLQAVAYPGILFGGGVQQIQLRTEEREQGSGGSCNLVQET